MSSLTRSKVAGEMKKIVYKCAIAFIFYIRISFLRRQCVGVFIHSNGIIKTYAVNIRTWLRNETIRFTESSKSYIGKFSAVSIATLQHHYFYCYNNHLRLARLKIPMIKIIDSELKLDDNGRTATDTSSSTESIMRRIT